MKTLRILMVLIIVLSLGAYVNMKSAHGEKPVEPKGKGPPPKPVKLVALSAEQISFEEEYENTEERDFDLASYVVPTGNRLVIEFASALVTSTLGEGENVTVTIETSVNQTISTHYLTLSEIFDGMSIKVYSGSQQIRVYSDPDTTVTIKGKRYSDCTNGACQDNFTFSGSISGYLVPLP